MKLRTHRRVLGLLPGVDAPMDAVDEAMGHRVVEWCLDVQKRVVTAS